MNLNFTYIVLGALIVLAIAGGVVMTVWPSASAGEIQVVEIAPTAAPAPTSTPMPSETRVGVYISGAVVNPGVYIVNGGSRLANVLLTAGGATAEADLTALIWRRSSKTKTIGTFLRRERLLYPPVGWLGRVLMPIRGRLRTDWAPTERLP